MSLLSKVRKGAAKLGGVASLLPGPIGVAAGIASSLLSRPKTMPDLPVPTQAAMPMLPSLPGAGRLPAVVGGAVGGAVRRGVGWIKAQGGKLLGYGIGGATIWQLASGEVVTVPRRRRGRGITGAQLRGYRRVCNLLRSMAPSATRCAPSRRRRKCA